MVTDNPRANGIGILADSFSVIAGASSKIPDVANTDKPKPYSTASHGSAISKIIAAIARAFSAQVLRPKATMTITLAVITAALRTLGSGPTNITYPTNDASETTVLPALPRRSRTQMR